MDRGRMLDEAHNVLVNVAGGPDMTLNEVQMLMEALGKHTGEETQILFGASVDAAMAGRIGVTIISSAGMGTAAKVQKPEFVVVPTLVQATRVVIPTASEPAEEEPAEIEEAPAACEVEDEVALAPDLEMEPEPEPMVAFAAMANGAEDEPQDSLLGLAPQHEAPLTEAHPMPPRVPRPPRAPRVPRIVNSATDPQPIAPAASRREERQETLQFEPVTRGRFEKSEPTIVDGQDLDVPTFLRRNMRVS